MKHKTIVNKISGYDANLHKLGLFLPYNMLAMKDGKQYDFSIAIKDLEGVPDCKICDFGNNIWYRPKAALDKQWSGYKTYSNLSRAVKNCLLFYGYQLLGWYEK